MSRVRCPAGRCGAHLLIDGILERGDGAAGPAVLGVRLRSPGGRVTEGTFPLGAKATGRQLRLSLPVPSPELWSPRHPALYAAELTLRVGGEVVQRESRAVGLRSVGVRSGLLYLNGRRVDLRGASIHEDMPGSGAGLSSADTARIVADLQAVGANVTRAHYLLSDELLSRLDRAGILVWSEAPIWQRDQPRDLLRTPAERRSALITVRRTVLAARSHPSVITHSVANELTLRPDERPSTRSFLVAAAHAARRLDPTLPISVDVKSHLGVARQSTYRAFDMLGINEYFGWYPWVPRLSGLVPYLRRMRGLYPRQALVVTEFGVEAPPRLAGASAKRRGSYAFQARYLQRTLSVLDRQRFLSGAIYWTLREFQIQPHWRGGLRSLPRSIDNTLNHKGLLTYDGVRKSAWYVARRSFARVGRP
jgi:beta-glucuronidase